MAQPRIGVDPGSRAVIQDGLEPAQSPSRSRAGCVVTARTESISERPLRSPIARYPGTGKGDLIIGKNHGWAIGTLVEPATRFVMLLHLPGGYGPAAVRDTLIIKIHTLPEQLRHSLTWDQGSEMHFHGQLINTTGMPV
jgi:transposase, IS30 family